VLFVEAFDDIEAVFHVVHHIPKSDHVGRTRKPHAATLAPNGLNVASGGEAIDNFHEVVIRNAVRLGSFKDCAQSIGMRAKKDKHAQRVIGKESELHI
jgi:hypothetical protein